MASARLALLQRHLAPTVRIALITGAAQGIGKAIALRLAEDGLDIALADLPHQGAVLDSVADIVRAKGRRAIALHADVAIEEDVQKMVAVTVEALGGLDVMVANAGVAAVTPMLQISTEELDRMFSINVKGTMLCYQAAAKVMIDQGRGGRIIGASSVAGKKGIPFFGSYSASKFAVRALTQVAASEFGRHKITVNAYAPSITETPLIDNLAAYMGSYMHADAEAAKKSLRSRAVLGRSGETSEIAALVSYLASEDAGYITGQSISIDGGTWYD